MNISNKMDNKLAFGSKAYLQLSKILGLIDTFKGAWQQIEHGKARYLKELRQMATVASVGSSTRIEGVKLSDQDIEKLLKFVKINTLQKRDEQEVIGYYEAHRVILDNYQNIELSERYIHQLHDILLKHCAKDEAHKGQYKSLSNKMVANYSGGEQKVIFNTTEPHLTPIEMQDLIGWTTQALQEEQIHPVLIIGTFVYEFLSIHPYQDGNGRLSRLITTLLLLQQGYNYVQYISFEHVIESKKDEYYRALMHSQKDRYSKNEKIDGWLLFFLECMIELTERLNTKHQTYSTINIVLNDRQKTILNYIKEQGSTTIGAIVKALHPTSRNTIKKDLIFLLSEGLILRTGAGRGVQYHFMDGNKS